MGKGLVYVTRAYSSNQTDLELLHRVTGHTAEGEPAECSGNEAGRAADEWYRKEVSGTSNQSLQAFSH